MNLNHTPFSLQLELNSSRSGVRRGADWLTGLRSVADSCQCLSDRGVLCGNPGQMVTVQSVVRWTKTLQFKYGFLSASIWDLTSAESFAHLHRC